MYSAGFLNEIKRRLDIATVINEYLPASRGKLLCECPFCPDRYNSLIINVKMQRYFCAGCRDGGDVFQFITRMQQTTYEGGIDFAVALAHNTYFAEIPNTVKEMAKLGGWAGR